MTKGDNIMNKWRWDQGRLEYFTIENIRKIASVFVEMNGCKDTKTSIDILRIPLQNATELPFSPSTYKVWRNYARVVKLGLIASRVDGVFHCTDIAKSLSFGEMASDSDLYFLTLARRFYYPSPVFDQYDSSATPTYPMLAIIKLLLTVPFIEKGITVDDVFTFLVGNNVTGLEDFIFYSKIRATSHIAKGDERRQVNEMLKVMSQISFLFWNKNHLYIDVLYKLDEIEKLYLTLKPEIVCTNIPNNADLAIIALGKKKDKSDFSSDYLELLTLRESEIDVIDHIDNDHVVAYEEGQRRMSNHIRLERNSKLRQHYLNASKEPSKCDMCHKTMRTQYPWVVNLIEIHHKLPLSSSIRVQGNFTLLEDIIGLCPSCHKAVHQFYRNYLKVNNKSDFSSKEEAFAVYEQAKALYTSTE